jgi:cytochrome c556
MPIGDLWFGFFFERKDQMRKWTLATCVLVVLGATVVAATSDDKTPTIEEVMDKLHKGRNSHLAKVQKALKSASPNWKTVQKSTKLFAELGAALPKNEAPKGDQAAYKKLAEAYASNAKALDEAAKDEDLAAAKSAIGKISGSCKACHNAHKAD